jgi:anti-sigma regulatory factor (Ser/Thr protein kinase)/CheY-like chemotaxis protein
MDGISSSPRILIAEASTATDTDLRIVLNELGLHFEAISEDVRVPNHTSHDVVIAELNVPLSDVNLWLQKIKGPKLTPCLVVMNKIGSADEVLSIIRAGASDVICPPFTAETLKSALSRIVINKNAPSIVYGQNKPLVYERREFEYTTLELATSGLRLRIIDRLEEAQVIDTNTKLQIDLAVQEALTNCLDHGNLELESVWKEEFLPDGQDKYHITRQSRLKDAKYQQKKIKIITEYNQKTLVIILKDSGKGFDVDKKKVAPVEQLHLHGRGLPILRGVMDEVSFSEGGTKVTLIKRFS